MCLQAILCVHTSRHSLWISKLNLLKVPRTKDTPVTVRKLVPRSWFLNKFFKKEMGFIREIVDYRTFVVKIQGKIELSCGGKNTKVFLKMGLCHKDKEDNMKKLLKDKAETI